MLHNDYMFQYQVLKWLYSYEYSMCVRKIEMNVLVCLYIYTTIMIFYFCGNTTVRTIYNIL